MKLPACGVGRGDSTDEAPASQALPFGYSWQGTPGSVFRPGVGASWRQGSGLSGSRASRFSPRPYLDAGDPSGRGFYEPRAGLLFVGGGLAFKSPFSTMTQ